MIHFRPYNQQKDVPMMNILTELGIENFVNLNEETKCFLVEDGGQIIGACVYDWLEPHIACIQAIYLNESERKYKLGDGLFRATLNSIELNGGSHVICCGCENEIAFYLHEGLDLISKRSTRVSEGIWDKGICSKQDQFAFLESIQAFFSKPCKGHKA